MENKFNYAIAAGLAGLAISCSPTKSNTPIRVVPTTPSVRPTTMPAEEVIRARFTLPNPNDPGNGCFTVFLPEDGLYSVGSSLPLPAPVEQYDRNLTFTLSRQEPGSLSLDLEIKKFNNVDKISAGFADYKMNNDDFKLSNEIAGCWTNDQVDLFFVNDMPVIATPR